MDQKIYVDSAERNELLVNECSGFLQDHASDKITWRPWGRDAIVEAAENDKPIMLLVTKCMVQIIPCEMAHPGHA